MAKPNTKEVT